MPALSPSSVRATFVLLLAWLLAAAPGVAQQPLNAPSTGGAVTAQPTQDDAAHQALVQWRFELLHRALPLEQLSADITDAVGDAERLLARGRLRPALDRLLQLQRHLPLVEIPSSRVQLLAAFLYTELGLGAGQAHARLGREQVQFLRRATGRGDAADPVRVLMASEIGDWAQAHGASVTEVQRRVLRGRELVAATLSMAVPGGAPAQVRELLFEIHPRARAAP
jgi:hypothetical protein